MNTALLYTTGSNNDWELEFIIELNLPEKLEPYTDGEVVCHVFPEEKTIEFSYDNETAEFLSKKGRFTRLFWAIMENYQKALDVQEEEEDWIRLEY